MAVHGGFALPKRLTALVSRCTLARPSWSPWSSLERSKSSELRLLNSWNGQSKEQGAWKIQVDNLPAFSWPKALHLGFEPKGPPGGQDAEGILFFQALFQPLTSPVLVFRGWTYELRSLVDPSATAHEVV